jgi:bifunctional oligoribonuclease and PAP phosphatase NrnA
MMLDENQQILERINKAKSILIAFPGNNFASTATALGLFHILKKMDKKIDVVTESMDPLANFLPGYGSIGNSIDNSRQFVISLDTSRINVGNVKYKKGDKAVNFIITPESGNFRSEDISCRTNNIKYDLAFILDAPDLESLGKIYDDNNEFFFDTTVINIDHRPENEEFGQINLLELNAVATAEIIFNLFSRYDRNLVGEEAATCLLAGIISETRSFKTQKITPSSLLASSELIAMGAHREEIINKLYRSRPINVLKLWGRALARLSGDLDNQLVWTTLSDFDFAKTGTSEKDLAEIIDELIVNLPDAKVAAIFYRQTAPDGQGKRDVTSVKIRSIKNIDLLEILKDLGAHGTKKSVELSLSLSLDEAERNIVEVLEKKLKEIWHR